MTCLVCHAALSAASRTGLQPSFCPRGHGAWLSQASLDALARRWAEARPRLRRILEWPRARGAHGSFSRN